ncbi:hypothetical protein CEXT_787451 [Caerostris extrusa]|uniref:Uncharacterized protein n=1 Tax=Caerostris extrusa TaxID=172846 RepID=A0AAV4VQ55_CAEEX|nr:hypothetical protein CEXT_787451 [Caerostris extrusa]
MYPRVGRNRPFHPGGRIESIDEIADSGMETSASNIRDRIAGTKHDVFPSEKRSRLYPDDKIGKPRSQETWDYEFDYPDIRKRAGIPSERQRPKGRLYQV